MDSVPESSAASPPIQLWTDRPPERTDVAIVGGGFSGLMTAVHLLTGSRHVTVTIFERLPRPFPGVAYGAADAAHLLNVRADRMGVVSSDPAGFAAWLATRAPGRYAPHDFVPRRLFGAYLVEYVTSSLAPFRNRVRLVHDGVSSIDRRAGRSQLRLSSGAVTDAAHVVLALGLPTSIARWQSTPDDRCVRDPWTPDALEGVNADDPVTILGTGLTALDVFVSLMRRGHRGLISFVSRHGRFPQPHTAPSLGLPPVAIDPAELAAGPRRALREIRGAAARARAAGRPWQDAMDAVRPHTTPTWQAWNATHRARFLARLRPFWEVHRHRAPEAVLKAVEDGVRAGRVETIRGTIEEVKDGGPAWSVSIRCVSGARVTRAAARVINCMGPAMRLTDSPDSLMRVLLSRGTITTDPAAVGVRADSAGRALNREGVPQERFFVLGALRRGDLWESTAVPELRVQAEAVAAALIASLDESGAVSRAS